MDLTIHGSGEGLVLFSPANLGTCCKIHALLHLVAFLLRTAIGHPLVEIIGKLHPVIKAGTMKSGKSIVELAVVGWDMNSDCKLLRGDCSDVLKDVESGSVDMVLADLPYGTTACKWDTRIPFEPLITWHFDKSDTCSPRIRSSMNDTLVPCTKGSSAAGRHTVPRIPCITTSDRD